MPPAYGLQRLPAQWVQWNPGATSPATLPLPWLDPFKQTGACVAAAPTLPGYNWGGAVARINWPAAAPIPGEEEVLAIGDLYARLCFPILPVGYYAGSFVSANAEYRNGLILSTADLATTPAAAFVSACSSRRMIGGVLTSTVYSAKWFDWRTLDQLREVQCCCSEPIVRMFIYQSAEDDLPTTVLLTQYSEDGGLGWRTLEQYVLFGVPTSIGYGCTGKNEEAAEIFSNECSGGAEYVRAFNLTPRRWSTEDEAVAYIDYAFLTGRSYDGGRNSP